MQRALHVLILSTDPLVAELARTSLQAEGHQLTLVQTDAEARSAVRSPFAGKPVDLVLYDLVLNEAGRLQPRQLSALRSLCALIAPARLALLCGMGDTRWQDAVRGLGIESFLTKPLLRQDLEQLTSRYADPDTRPSVPTMPSAPPPFHMEEVGNNRFFLAASSAMREIREQVSLLAPVDVPVLILGESGVGKEIVASLLHQHSARANKNFVNVNCAALPADLLESELFGHEAGAFTGATREKPGKFELADKGTLLLDEIAEMSAPMQAKLLHVLQDGQFSRLGSQHSTRVDVRILAATNVEVGQAIAERRFREDLLYRLNTFTIAIPSLRERREEIPFLLEQMRRRTAAELKVPSEEFSPELVAAAIEFDWPGNLRELRNFVTRTIVMRNQAAAVRELRTRTRISVNSSPSAAALPEVPSTGDMREVVRDLKGQTESRMIQEALHISNWNRRRAALRLNISYRALLYKIQQYRLTPTA